MLEATLRVLEYDKVRTILAGYAVTGPGRERLEGLSPLADPEAVPRALAETAEMTALLEQGAAPRLGGSRDLRGYLGALRAEGAYLQPDALLEVHSSLETARECRRTLAREERAPLLSEMAGGLSEHPDLAARIAESIGPRGEILDGASFALGEIRRQIRQGRERIKRTLESLLSDERLAGVFQERLITERNGRYVVPLRADHRGRIKGFVHDESASGQTLYLEPAQVLSGNNALQRLLGEEQREILRILRRLGSEVRQAGESLLANQAILAHFDLRAAAGRFARLTDARAPELVGAPLVELREARHPLLLLDAGGDSNEREAVPVDLLLQESCDTLVISGPNTGGKTVALKTLGLLVLMVRSGLPVPCAEGSRLHLFSGVFADIGDEQSIEQSLSTFSGHLARVVEILGAADHDSLVLLDEAGTGTDPEEGGALALAVIDALRQRGARTVLTTHLNLIKGMAHLKEGVMNAAVEFDQATLAPTYRLHYGIPGASSAFAIARRLGLPEAVLEKASGYLGEGEREGLAVVERLNRMRRDLDQELAETRRLKEGARREQQQRRELRQKLEGERQEILDKAVRQGEQVVREARRKVRGLLDEARQAAGATRDQARIAGDLRQVEEEVARERPGKPRQGAAPREVEVGEILKVVKLGAEGKVTRLMEDGAELDLQGKKMRLPLSELEPFSPRRFASGPKSDRGLGKVVSRVERERFEPRLVLVGRRVEEALPLLERFLDDALLHGIRELEIVHGAGTGALRQAVREVLGAHREVATFHGAAPEQGGDNVTVVTMRGR